MPILYYKMSSYTFLAQNSPSFLSYVQEGPGTFFSSTQPDYSLTVPLQLRISSLFKHVFYFENISVKFTYWNQIAEQDSQYCNNYSQWLQKYFRFMSLQNNESSHRNKTYLAFKTYNKNYSCRKKLTKHETTRAHTVLEPYFK